MNRLDYWRELAADAVKHEQSVHVFAADLQALVAYAVSLEEQTMYLQAEMKRLERLALNNGS